MFPFEYLVSFRTHIQFILFYLFYQIFYSFILHPKIFLYASSYHFLLTFYFIFHFLKDYDYFYLLYISF